MVIQVNTPIQYKTKKFTRTILGINQTWKFGNLGIKLLYSLKLAIISPKFSYKSRWTIDLNTPTIFNTINSLCRMVSRKYVPYSERNVHSVILTEHKLRCYVEKLKNVFVAMTENKLSTNSGISYILAPFWTKVIMIFQYIDKYEIFLISLFGRLI